MESKQVDIDATTRAEIVQNLSEKLRAYVFPDIAEQICMRRQ